MGTNAVASLAPHSNAASRVSSTAGSGCGGGSSDGASGSTLAAAGPGGSSDAMSGPTRSGPDGSSDAVSGPTRSGPDGSSDTVSGPTRSGPDGSNDAVAEVVAGLAAESGAGGRGSGNAGWAGCATWTVTALLRRAPSQAAAKDHGRSSDASPRCRGERAPSRTRQLCARGSWPRGKQGATATLSRCMRRAADRPAARSAGPVDCRKRGSASGRAANGDAASGRRGRNAAPSDQRGAATARRSGYL